MKVLALGLAKEELKPIQVELKKYGQEVILAKDVACSISMVLSFGVDAVIIGIAGSKSCMVELCSEFKKYGIDAPVIVLSSQRSDSLMADCFNKGVADYIVAPFSPRELVLRLEVRTRKFYQPQALQLCSGSIRLEQKTHCVMVANRELALSPKEYELLRYLIIHKNIVVSKSELLSYVWHAKMSHSSNRVEVYIRHLRSKLTEEADSICTVRGYGYILKDS